MKKIGKEGILLILYIISLIVIFIWNSIDMVINPYVDWWVTLIRLVLIILSVWEISRIFVIIKLVIEEVKINIVEREQYECEPVQRNDNDVNHNLPFEEFNDKNDENK